MSEREKWLNGYYRDGSTVAIGTGCACVGCGAILGIICVVIDEDMPEPIEPSWPFDKETCPICSMRENERKLMRKISEGPEDKLTARLKALRGT